MLSRVNTLKSKIDAADTPARSAQLENISVLQTRLMIRKIDREDRTSCFRALQTMTNFKTGNLPNVPSPSVAEINSTWLPPPLPSGAHRIGRFTVAKCRPIVAKLYNEKKQASSKPEKSDETAQLCKRACIA